MSVYLSDADYKLVTSSVPIVCVDMIPVRQQPDGGLELGVITRATGSQAGGAALVGGRVQYGESIGDAIARHLQADLEVGAGEFELYRGNAIARPFYVQQYWPGGSSEAPFGFDPTKHSIGLTYLVELQVEPMAANEASAFQWLSVDELPTESAFNQHFVLQAARDFLLDAVS